MATVIFAALWMRSVALMSAWNDDEDINKSLCFSRPNNAFLS